MQLRTLKRLDAHMTRRFQGARPSSTARTAPSSNSCAHNASERLHAWHQSTSDTGWRLEPMLSWHIAVPCP